MLLPGIAVASWGANRLDIFVVGTDNALYHKAWDGSWYPSETTWENLGGQCASAPAVASWGANRLDIFVVGTDNALYHKAWDGSWYPSETTWENLGGQMIVPSRPLPPVPCNCAECPPDPNFACSNTGEDVIVQDAYIANAYRGNLLLSPGSALGPIGGLLHDLNPPQHYTHMGIFVADLSLIRHCTMSDDRLNEKKYYTGTMFGQPVPLDGLRHDLVQYGWPGSITQSVEQAFYADRYGTGTPPGHSGPYKGAMLTDWASQQQSSYLINALSFDSVSDDGHTWYPPLIVKPCPLLQTPAVTQALQDVVSEALKMYAHYRFYAYTKGSIGDDPEFQGPPVKLPIATPAWDSASNKWTDWSDPMAVSWVTVPTIPAVCSSFVWQAVQNTSREEHGKIVLDWAPSPTEALGENQASCARLIQPILQPDGTWAGDIVDADTLDGLYVYSQDERQAAGNYLHDAIAQQVYDSVKGDVPPAVKSVLDDVGRGSFIAAAAEGVNAVTVLLDSTPLGPVVGGLGAAFVSELIELLYDMPEDIANQVCNAFAFDCINGGPADTHCVDSQGNIIADIDSSNWSSAAGTGRAVSPDNIHWFWDAPGPSVPSRLQGIYGFNEEAALCVGYFSKPKCVLVPSTGTATIFGTVEYKSSRVAGAYVTASCQGPAISTTKGYELQVRAGAQYKVVARYKDPGTGLWLYGEKTTGIIQANSANDTPITLTAPPNFMRNIVVAGWIRVDDVYLTGADHNDNYFNTTVFLQAGVAKFDQATATWTMDTSQQILADSITKNAATGDTNGVLTVQLTLDPANLSVAAAITGQLNPGDENISQVHNVTIMPGQTTAVPEFDLDDGDTFPDRAYFRNIAITNLPAQAI
jgi:hypothetical protein